MELSNVTTVQMLLKNYFFVTIEKILASRLILIFLDMGKHK